MEAGLKNSLVLFASFCVRTTLMGRVPDKDDRHLCDRPAAIKVHVIPIRHHLLRSFTRDVFSSTQLPKHLSSTLPSLEACVLAVHAPSNLTNHRWFYFLPEVSQLFTDREPDAAASTPNMSAGSYSVDKPWILWSTTRGNRSGVLDRSGSIVCTEWGTLLFSLIAGSLLLGIEHKLFSCTEYATVRSFFVLALWCTTRKHHWKCIKG